MGKPTDSREYRAWINMRSRCYTPSSTGFDHYGGRGIRVCDRWKDSFANFLEDMGPRPSPRHSLDRIDCNGDYSPENCRWVTPTVQNRNTTRQHFVTVNGSRMTLADAAEGNPLPYNTILYRLRRGWSINDALARPQQRGRRP